jgi:protein-S-isoprenylcysteine O-methyltransferase Ste14
MQADNEGLNEERTGLNRFFYNLRRKRFRYRQFLGIVILILFTILGDPARFPFAATLYTVGAALAVLGIAIRLWASGHVKKNQVLATTGPYAYVRHPLYVGNHLIMIGFCLASGLWWSFVVYIVFSLYFYPQTIRHEDRHLSKLFPGEWEPWAKQTRALIPRLTPYRTGQSSEWSFMQSLRANGEPIIAALLLLCLYVLHTRLYPA